MYAFTGLLDSRNYSVPQSGLWATAVVFVLGLVIRWLAQVLTLSRNVSVAGAGISHLPFVLDCRSFVVYTQQIYPFEASYTILTVGPDTEFQRRLWWG